MRGDCFGSPPFLLEEGRQVIIKIAGTLSDSGL